MNKNQLHLMNYIKKNLKFENDTEHYRHLEELVSSEKIDADRLSAYVSYLNDRINLDIESYDILDEKFGVGLVFTDEEVAEIVAEVMKEHNDWVENGWEDFQVLAYLDFVREKSPWIPRKLITMNVEKIISEMHGEKPKGKKKKAKKPQKETKDVKQESVVPLKEDEFPKIDLPLAGDTVDKSLPIYQKAAFPAPHQNTILNNKDMLLKHLERTGGCVVTRFPPEPNGYLHIGHAKAMYLSFREAEVSNGYTNLRFDDTNPEAESDDLVETIKQDIGWMGYTPKATNFASGYFDNLYAYCEQLISQGDAYVDFTPLEKMSEMRQAHEPSSYRDTTPEENLKLFRRMRAGFFDEGECIVRMKMDYTSPKPCMWDLSAYRIKYVPHHQSGDKWCIYPMYDFTHCICDSIEDITHSLCSLEFQNRQDSYYWLLEKLGLYKPFVWEFSRLNITHNVMSKRYINKLIDLGIVDGFDDPRLLTLQALRRRGVRPEAVKAFCREVSYTRNDNTSVDPDLLNHFIRTDADATHQRRFAVLNPVRLIIEDLPLNMVEMPNFPKDASAGSRQVPVSSVCFIEKSDFKTEEQLEEERVSTGKKVVFYGLVPGRQVNLRYLGCVEYVSHDDEEIHVRYIGPVDKKVKGNLHWVSDGAVDSVVHRYSRLFTHPTPRKTDNWLAHVNADSHQIYGNAKVEPSLGNCEKEEKFQFERVGYFVADSKEYTKEKPVFIEIIGLK
eukprot:TRINITY_DN2970_c0_g2_i1.p1 TRINITY_DN2970_c0_g2~~TRINITY_DN2970_c0_g2_i1.p1  ORF type:complete len:727 (-),score=220.09 TRINITY_DN2970_c0_g2_i1:13-2193(-)